MVSHFSRRSILADLAIGIATGLPRLTLLSENTELQGATEFVVIFRVFLNSSREQFVRQKPAVRVGLSTHR
jgi:hypothetical protein